MAFRRRDSAVHCIRLGKKLTAVWCPEPFPVTDTEQKTYNRTERATLLSGPAFSSLWKLLGIESSAAPGKSQNPLDLPRFRKDLFGTGIATTDHLMMNSLTIDLEDYYQVSAFSERVDRAQWGTFESHVEANTAHLLDLFARHGVHATFFTLGWVARRHPRLIQQVAQAGHEIACHSDVHRRVFEMTPEEFRSDTLRAKQSLEDIAGVPAVGYRAPSFSITENSAWAFSILAELGFVYDSSIFPIRHPNYGLPQAPAVPFEIHTCHGKIIEFPMPTLGRGRVRVPFGGGAYFRLLPYWFTRWSIGYLNAVRNQPVCVYLHPWELDRAQPRLDASLSARARHYLGIAGTEAKLRKLIREFDFQPLGALVRNMEFRCEFGEPPKEPIFAGMIE